MLTENGRRYRVVQWATGTVGASSLRAVIDHPDMELVGVYVYSEDKEGRDAGELCGLSPVGVAATRDIEAIVALGPDCVLYMPEHGEDDELCRLLESGANVVTTCLAYYSRSKLEPGRRARIEAACAAGGSSLHASGSSPGFITEALPIVLTSLSRRLDCLTIDEYADCTGVCSEDMLFNYIGFGEAPEVFAKRDLAKRDQCFEDSLGVLADALGLPLSGFETSSDFGVAKAPIQIGSRTLEAGTVAAQRFVLTGLHHGTPLLRMRTNWYVTANVEPDLDLLTTGWRVRVEGDTPLDVSIAFPVAEEDRERVMPQLTSHRPVNAVPVVCEADPGILTTVDLPQVIATLR